MTRSVDEIGAGLAPARPGVPLDPTVRLHVMGVGGTAALGAALHARALGVDVTGCDRDLSPEAAAMLRDAGITVLGGEGESHVAGRTRLAVSKAITSVTPNHPELAAARSQGVPLLSVQQIIADAAAARGGALIGVAGTHGKTTSTGWLLAALRASGADPSAFVGGPLGERDGTPPSSPVHIGGSNGFVVEADEYGGNFDAYAADAALLLNADWDHPDIFVDLDAVVATFVAWALPVLGRGALIVNVADSGGAAIARALMASDPTRAATSLYTYAAQTAGERSSTDAPRNTTGGTIDVTASILAEADGGVALRNLHLSPRAAAALPALAGLAGERLGISLLGAHNAANALGVAMLAAACGGTAAGIRHALATFSGVGRRLEVRFDDGERTVLDDYGHHPTAIRATIETVRARYPGRKLILAIEPLTYHRTAALLEPLAAAAAAADEVVVVDIFAVRDTDLTITSAAALAAAISRRGVAATAPGSAEVVAAAIATSLPPRAVVLVMGGGRSTILASQLAARLVAGR